MAVDYRVNHTHFIVKIDCVYVATETTAAAVWEEVCPPLPFLNPDINKNL